MKFSPSLLRAAVYGANDGIITTFAVVAGVAGAGLSSTVILVLGIANLFADGLSMGLGDYLGERSERKLQLKRGEQVNTEPIWWTGSTTFVAFAGVGAMPLVPYMLSAIGLTVPLGWQFPLSGLATGITLFVVGASRSILTEGNWFYDGIEMLGVGAIAAVVAFGLGAGVERLVTGM